MYTHFPCKVPITAPTSHQLQDILHAEIAQWWRSMPTPLYKLFELKNERFEMIGEPERSFAAFRTGNKSNPDALQGFHSDNLFFVLDEAAGIDDIVFEVAEGALSTPGARVLMTANPTRLSGYFYDSHHKMRNHWKTMRVSCEDSTRVTPAYITGMRERHGADSNIYRVRVLGEFPLADDDVLMPLQLVEAAVSRDVVPITSILPVWGVDVARYGNCRTALAKRRGNALMEPVKSWHKRDLMEVSGLILAEYEETPSDEMPAEILVDSVGLGAGVVDRLRELGLPVRGVNVGESPSGKGRFNRLRDELWWRGREWFESRDSTMPDDDVLIGQLTTLTYRFTSAGKIQIEGKERMLERGLQSPDEADAFILTFAGLDKRGQIKDRYKRKPKRRASSWAA